MSGLNSNIYLSVLNDSLVDGLINGNISYIYNIGVILGVSFMIQIISGVLCTFYYVGTISDSFNSIEILMSEVSNGYLLSYILANGVSLIFICLYVHIFKALYYGSYIVRSSNVFISGVLILLLSIIIAFLGYSLVSGIQSYWAIVVITNLLSSIRIIGNSIVILIWSNYSRSTLTISSFFSLLYLLRFILLGIMIALIVALLELAGTTLIGISGNISMLNFLSSFTLKDLFRVLIYIGILGSIVCFIRNKLEDRENNIEFNRLVTRNAIVPLWYLLRYYAILSSISNNLLGVIAMILSILVLMVLRYNSTVLSSSCSFNLLVSWFLLLFISSFMILLVLGSKLRSERFIILAQISGIYYFSFILVIMRTVGIILNILVW